MSEVALFMILWLVMVGMTPCLSARVELSDSGTSDIKIWHCASDSARTYKQCQLNGREDKGCYFLEHFAQYRACFPICDGGVADTIDESRCASFCVGFLEEYCSLRKLADDEDTIDSRQQTELKAETHSKMEYLGFTAVVVPLALVIVGMVWRKKRPGSDLPTSVQVAYNSTNEGEGNVNIRVNRLFNENDDAVDYVDGQVNGDRFGDLRDDVSVHQV